MTTVGDGPHRTSKLTGDGKPVIIVTFYYVSGRTDVFECTSTFSNETASRVTERIKSRIETAFAHEGRRLFDTRIPDIHGFDFNQINLNNVEKINYAVKDTSKE